MEEEVLRTGLFTIFAQDAMNAHGRNFRNHYAFDNITAELIVDAETSLMKCWQEATRITQRAKVERESGSHGAMKVGAL